jgi:hypothetical protein
MAFTGNAVANSFKQQLFQGGHNFNTTGGNTFKLALYTSAATLTSSTTVYTSTNEVVNTGTYSTGGGVLANVSPLVSSGVAFIDFADISFTGVTLTAAGALIYNTSNANAAVCVLDFGGDKTATSGTFTIQFPADTTAAAILRIGNA